MPEVTPELVARIEAGMKDLAEIFHLRPKVRKDEEVTFHSEVVKSCQWANACWQAVFTALTTRDEGRHEPKSHTMKLWESFMIEYSRRYLDDSAVPVLKYHLAYIFARSWDQDELPEVPAALNNREPGIFAGGWIRRRLKLIMTGDSFLLRMIALDLLMSKKGFPKVPESLILGSYQKHETTLGKDPIRPFEEGSELLELHLGEVSRLVALESEGYGPWIKSFYRYNPTPAKLEKPSYLDELLKKERYNLPGFDTGSVQPGWGQKCSVAKSRLLGCAIYTAEMLTKRLFEGTHFEPTPHFGSSSAAFGFPRTVGGQMSNVLGFDSDGWNPDAYLWNLHGNRTTTSVKPQWTPNGLVYSEYPVNDMGDEPFSWFVSWLFDLEDHRALPALDSIVEHYRQQEIENETYLLEKSDNRSHIKAQPSDIPEPLKVRMITLGEAIEYHRCKELQLLMIDTIGKVPCFEYTQHPITPENWAARFSRPLQEGEFWVSGDYKAATDNLNKYLSEAIWRAICETVRVGPVSLLDYQGGAYYRLGLKALTGHSLLYPDETREGHFSDQKNGQLMGSPLSFPILCIANAAAYLTALGRSVGSLYEPGIAINGDDIAFACNEREYENWKLIVTACGLEPSIGKNYTSTEFLIINSELHTYHGDREEHWTYCPYVSLPLLLGLVDKGKEAGRDISGELAVGEIGSRANQLVKGFSGKLSDFLITRYLKNIDRSLERIKSKVGNKVGYYVPTNLGGFGIPPKSDTVLQEYDRKWCAVVACLDARKYIKITSLPGTAEETRWDSVLERVDKVLELYSPKVPSSAFPTVLNKRYEIDRFKAEDHGPEGLVKVAMFCAEAQANHQDIQHWFLPGARRGWSDHLRSQPRVDLGKEAAWANIVHQVSALTVRTSLGAMEPEKIKTFPKRYRLIHSQPLAAYPGVIPESGWIPFGPAESDDQRRNFLTTGTRKPAEELSPDGGETPVCPSLTSSFTHLVQWEKFRGGRRTLSIERPVDRTDPIAGDILDSASLQEGPLSLEEEIAHDS